MPAKVLLQLSSVFEKGGLRDRNGTFQYKDHLRQGNVPILALAGDQDLICPPEAVYGRISTTIPECPHHGFSLTLFITHIDSLPNPF